MARILIVEDTPANRRLAAAVLASAQHVALQAADAAEGIGVARRERPDLILMDVQLPGMDGLEATRILKTDPRTRAIPVIALTAFAMKGDRERFLESGCDGYLDKPYTWKALLAEIDRLLAKPGGGT